MGRIKRATGIYWFVGEAVGSLAVAGGQCQFPVGAFACRGGGNERADQQAAKGAKISLQQVTVHKRWLIFGLRWGLRKCLEERTDSDVLGGGGGLE